MFIFQADGGIRIWSVTGVQTWTLPRPPTCGRAARGKSSSPAAPRNNARAYLTRLSGSRRRRATAPHKAAKTGAASIRAPDSTDGNPSVGFSKAFTDRLTLRPGNREIRPQSDNNPTV